MRTNTINRVFIIDRQRDDALQQQAVIEDYCPNAIVHRCKHARDALTQLRRFPNIPVDLILLSIQEYQLGGSQFVNLAQMKATAHSYNPVVILTVSSNEQLEAFKARQSFNYSDFLHKPLMPGFFEYLLEFHFNRDGANTVKSPSADSP